MEIQSHFEYYANLSQANLTKLWSLYWHWGGSCPKQSSFRVFYFFLTSSFWFLYEAKVGDSPTLTPFSSCVVTIFCHQIYNIYFWILCHIWWYSGLITPGSDWRTHLMWCKGSTQVSCVQVSALLAVILLWFHHIDF